MPESLADIYRSTYRALVRFLYRKVWDAERAEDLAQEAFARALVHRPENPRGWLFIVAANMARDDARRAIRERAHLTLLKHITHPTRFIWRYRFMILRRRGASMVRCLGVRKGAAPRIGWTLICSGISWWRI